VSATLVFALGCFERTGGTVAIDRPDEQPSALLART